MIAATFPLILTFSLREKEQPLNPFIKTQLYNQLSTLDWP